MWEVVGKPVDAKSFADFKPLRILYEFDGPRIFTLEDPDKDLFLAYQCDETTVSVRFLVVPITSQLEQDLCHGRSAVREVLEQPRLWIVDIGEGWKPLCIWKTSLHHIPEDAFPEPGTMLLPILQPLITLRSIGQGIKRGETPGSVIRSVIESTEKCLKTLFDYVLEQTAQSGRPTRSIRRLYDLPAQRFAFNSFEISFSRPVTSDQKKIEELEAADVESERQLFSRVGDLLQRGLRWIASHPTSSLQGSHTTSSLQGSNEEKRAILQSLLNLTPSNYGYIERIELRGQLLGTLPFEEPAACQLDRSSRQLVKSYVSLLAPAHDKIVTPIGMIREADKDRCSFELREIEDDTPTMKFVFVDDELGEDVFDAFNGDYKVKVVGLPVAGTNAFQAIAIERHQHEQIGDSSEGSD